MWPLVLSHAMPMIEYFLVSLKSFIFGLCASILNSQRISILGMPAEIQTARALSIVSALIWFIMMIVGVMGLECTVYKKGTMHKVDSS